MGVASGPGKFSWEFGDNALRMDSLPTRVYYWSQNIRVVSLANPVKWQFSFRSPKSANLPRVIGNFDDPLQIGSSDWHHFYADASCYYIPSRNKRKKCK